VWKRESARGRRKRTSVDIANANPRNRSWPLHQLLSPHRSEHQFLRRSAQKPRRICLDIAVCCTTSNRRTVSVGSLTKTAHKVQYRAHNSDAVTGYNSQSDQSTQHRHKYSFMIQFNIIFRCKVRFRKRFLARSFSRIIFYGHLISSMSATCPVQPNLDELATQNIHS
jgi:hypothetical protein